MAKVILLTGAPATGKSTLRRNLAVKIPGLVAFDYGRLLLEMKANDGVRVSYEVLRAQSAKIISPADVHTMDEKVIEKVAHLRQTSHVILDSHAITREAYGFRAKTYSADQLMRLRLDVVLVLRCDPETVIRRMSADRRGRRDVSVELAREHQTLQECTGLFYAIACGCPFFVLDTTEISEEDVTNQAVHLLSEILNE